MHRAGSARWFHTLVVVGASLSACGGKAERDGSAPNGFSGAPDAGGASGIADAGGASGIADAGGASGIADAGGTGGVTGNASSPRSPSDCAYDGAFVCADYDNLVGCYCNVAAPQSPADCASPFAYLCHDYPPAPGSGATISSNPDRSVGCLCQATYVVPEDCNAPEQFICDSIDHGYANCRCDPTLPTSAAACSPDNPFSCQSENPRFGCMCFCCIIK
jgi:hypothetical protein